MVQILNQIDLLAFESLGNRCLYIGHVALIADRCALIVSGQEGISIVRRSAESDGRINGDVTGQILILSAESVEQPRSPTRTRERSIGAPGIIAPQLAGGRACRCRDQGASKVRLRAWQCLAAVRGTTPECPYCLNLL